MLYATLKAFCTPADKQVWAEVETAGAAVQQSTVQRPASIIPGSTVRQNLPSIKSLDGQTMQRQVWPHI